MVKYFCIMPTKLYSLPLCQASDYLHSCTAGFMSHNATIYMQINIFCQLKYLYQK